MKRHPLTAAQRKVLSQRLLLVISAAIAGFVLANMHLFITTSVPPTPSVSPIVRKTDSPSTTSNLPLQNNPLFTSHPAWSQDFETQKSGLLNPSYWNVITGPAANDNNEQQYYTNNQSNLQLKNGALYLTATHQTEPDNYHYGSARIESQGKQSFLYGRLDVTAQLPSGAGTWPAIWMLPANNVYESKSAASDVFRYRNGGEIDIMESVGFQPNVVYGVAHTASDQTLHPDGTGSYNTISIANSSTAYNTYTLLWTPTSVSFAVNGTTYYTYARSANADYTQWPFDQPFYLIINLAMGGTWGGLDTAHYPINGIDNSALPSTLKIQSIYYYPYIGK